MSILINETIIIGKGFAGLSAKLYLDLYKKKSKLINNDKNKVVFYEILNYPGILKTNSFDLLNCIEKQINSNDLINDDIINISKNIETETIILKSLNNTYYCKYLLICTGFIYRKIDLKNITIQEISHLNHDQVVENKNILILGSGDRSEIYTKQLLNKNNKINIITKGSIKSEYLKNLKHENINIFTKAKINKIENNKVYFEYMIENKILNEEKKIDLIIFAIGFKPNLPEFNNINLTMNGNYIKVDFYQNTNEKNIFAAGIVHDNEFQQCLNSCHYGSVAAMSILKRINPKESFNYF